MAKTRITRRALLLGEVGDLSGYGGFVCCRFVPSRFSERKPPQMVPLGIQILVKPRVWRLDFLGQIYNPVIEMESGFGDLRVFSRSSKRTKTHVSNCFVSHDSC